MKIIRAAALLCTFLLAMGAFAFQNSSAQSGSSPAGQMGAQAPQANNGQSRPDQSSATQSNSQSTTGQTSSGAATTPSQAGAAGASSGPSDAEVQQRIDAQVKILADQLNLSNDQQTKTRTILLDQHQQAMSIVGDSAASRDQKMEKIHALRESTISKVRTTLNDDQKKKFDQMVAEQDQRMHPQGSPSGPGNNSGASNYPNNNSSNPPK